MVENLHELLNEVYIEHFSNQKNLQNNVSHRKTTMTMQYQLSALSTFPQERRDKKSTNRKIDYGNRPPLPYAHRSPFLEISQ